MLPLAPAHLRATRDGSGDITLAWARRSRADADSWTPRDAPLDYAPEVYRLTLFNGATAVRVLDTSIPTALYTAAQQSADFDAWPAAFAFTVSQLSPVYGPGRAAAGHFLA